MPRRQVAGGGTLHAKLLTPERQVHVHTGLQYMQEIYRKTPLTPSILM
ncbi:MAG: hypothetical protein ACRC2T_05305 [Thermoguttaceae bacterium]